LSPRIFVTILVPLLAAGQTPNRPAFEIASLKPSRSSAPAQLTSNPGTWSCLNCRLFDLLGHAYKVFEYQIVAPDWTKAATFDVIVQLPPGVAPGAWATKVDVDPFALRMQSLLEDRFRMMVHRENRELPVYDLVIANGGHKLREVTAAPAPVPAAPPVDRDGFPNIPGGNGMRLLPHRGRIQFQRQAMVHFAHFLSTQVDRPVLDATGLTSLYALTLSWYREPEPGPTLFQAIQDQLGLKLQPAKGVVETIVIDRLEKKPTEN
jgi:uncharacterized protein (TIGR03435 family)